VSQERKQQSSLANLSRRGFLHGMMGTAAYAASGMSYVFAQEKTAKGSGTELASELIPRQRNPDNLEFPFATLEYEFATPNEKFYVRNHFPQPKLEADSWRLKVEGAVNREREFTLGELRKLPSRIVMATLECAGNCRAFLNPKVKGVPWQLGAVGCAWWTGVPLAAVLEKVGLRDSAVEMVLEGADSGEITADIKPTGPIHFARSLPLVKARAPEVLLAYEMNGVQLPPAHGYPLRAIVPGWYGMASIKWLQRLVVTDRPFNGYFQTFDYSYFSKDRGLSQVVPITELEVKAQIARPAAGEIIQAGTDYQIHGAAWTGEYGIAKVEVSLDGGRSWLDRVTLGEPMPQKGIPPYAWSLWSYRWHKPKKGEVRIMARATDKRGRVQPLTRDPDRRNYMISHILPVDVTVR
jgi:DMSO/TMAO reductase YedYZ molybdopterin-dependent catalytic subunit